MNDSQLEKRKKSRTENSIANVASNTLIMILKTVLTFVTRTVFIKVLGETMLGLNGLFTNIISMLSLAELGVSTAINFSLYKPLSEKDNKRISSIMTFYKKIYHIVGFAVFILGILVTPLFGIFIKGIEITTEIYVIYFLYLLNTSSSYFISYKETLIIADQKNYKLTGINFISLLVLNILQIIGLMISKNFIVYLLIQFAVQFIQRYVTNYYITKQYINVDFNTKEKINTNDKEQITKNVKAMFFHKIGDYCVNGTDNLIISSFINVATVGIYSNYLLISTTVNNLISNVFNSIISSLGNLIATENKEKRLEVFKIINFLAFCLYGLCSVCMVNVITTFMKLWIGEEYCLDVITTILIIVNFYITGMRVSVYAMKSAAGLYDIDKYTPTIQAAVNLIISIALVQSMGLTGIIIGTIVSGLVLPCWQRPYLVYKYVIGKSSKEYFVEYIKYIIIIVSASYCAFCVNSVIPINNLLLKFTVNGTISAIIFSTIVLILFRKKSELNYIINLLKEKVLKCKKV